MHQPTTPHPKRQAAAYRTLYDRGARFVLCRADKRPLWRRWQKRRPDLATVQLHVKGGDPVGLVPFSIKSTGLDVDRGDPSQLFSLYPPVVAIPSKRRGGLHGYYGDGQGRANGRFELHGCAGEIRGSRGYLVLHGNAALELAGADFDVAEGLPGWFPANLWEAAGLAFDLPKIAAPYSPSAEAATVWESNAADALAALAHIRPGARNTSLFNAVRFFAYSQPRPGELTRWRAHIFDYTLNANARFSEPLPTTEALQTAWSIASWCWNGGGPLDHSPAAQRRRGVKSGKARRAKTADRDRRIVQLAQRGPKAQREIAELVGHILQGQVSAHPAMRNMGRTLSVWGGGGRGTRASLTRQDRGLAGFCGRDALPVLGKYRGHPARKGPDNRRGVPGDQGTAGRREKPYCSGQAQACTGGRPVRPYRCATIGPIELARQRPSAPSRRAEQVGREALARVGNL